MNIAYFEPLSRGWNRMTKALFKPFDISKWFAVGFTAFLAGLTDFHSGGNSGIRESGGDTSVREFFHFPGIAWEWLMDNPGWFTLIVFGIIFLFCLTVLLIWLSSRGKFMFLHNVVHDAKDIAKPWREYGRQGDSLFLWRLCFALICFAVFIAFFILCFLIALSAYENNYSKQLIVLYIIGGILTLLLLVVVTGYISLFLNDFVVPLMYKYKITAVQAWGRFLSLFSKHILYFIFWGILIFLLNIVVVIAVIIFGLCSCCILILLLIIPYIGSVVFLPVSYTFRAFSIEFLAQFGPEYSVFAKTAK